MAPLDSYHWLTNLKSAQLKTLAAALGTNSTGTKAALITALQAHIPTGLFPQDSHKATDPRGPRRRHDIISIDMGIRNLAYCRITLPASWPSTSDSTKTAVPKISKWARIAVSSKATSDASSSTTKKKNKKKEKKGRQTSSDKTNDASTMATDEADQTEAPTSSNIATKESFDPATFSQHAYNLITHLLTQHPATPPTQILIERQRFRSMGGSAVQEWTLRVNMFEAMLYAVLRTLREEGRWVGGEVYAVVPGKVGRFWLGDDGEGRGGGIGGGNEEVEVERESGEGSNGKKKKTKTKKEPSSSKSARTKTAKIKMLEGWLTEVFKEEGQQKIGEGRRFTLEGRARDLGEAFLRKRRGMKDVKVRQEAIGGTGVEDVVAIGKLDDLADCVLQGMAWVKWEENRLKVLAQGADILKEFS